jgi:CDP-diacylglycerol--glycerol-3-phosphate 3-phosphatidyltransferase
MNSPSTNAARVPAAAYRWLWWITPNQLTYARIGAVPLLMVLIWIDRSPADYVAWVVFFVACLTDYWDGSLARTRKEVSQAGKLLDPIADKMLISASLVMLVARGSADPVPTVLILIREFAVSGLRQVAAIEGIAIAATRGAKAKTILQMIATGTLLFGHEPFGLPLNLLGRGLLWVAVAWTLWTGFAYFAEYHRSRRAAKTP